MCLGVFKEPLHSSVQKTTSIVISERLKEIMFWCKCLFKYLIFSQNSFADGIKQTHLPRLLHLLLEPDNFIKWMQAGPKCPSKLRWTLLCLPLTITEILCGKDVLQYCLLLRQKNSLQLPVVPKEVTKTSLQRDCAQCPIPNSSDRTSVQTSDAFRHHREKNETLLL